MQQLFDDIEAKKLGNPLPFNDQPCLECFAIPFQKELGAAIFWLEDASLQAKNCMQKEHTGSHQEILNCAQKRYTKTATLCLSIKDANGEIWSVKLIGNSHKKAGSLEASQESCFTGSQHLPTCANYYEDLKSNGTS
jgi:hypothetical protein